LVQSANFVERDVERVVVLSLREKVGLAAGIAEGAVEELDYADTDKQKVYGAIRRLAEVVGEIVKEVEAGRVWRRIQPHEVHFVWEDCTVGFRCRCGNEDVLVLSADGDPVRCECGKTYRLSASMRVLS